MATYDITTDTLPNKFNSGDIINCPYSGTYKTLTLKKGIYTLECWGAEGTVGGAGGTTGKGGYVKGTIELTSNQNLYLYSGGTGTNGTTGGTSGFNGGGKGYSSNGRVMASGGGGSDVRIGSTSLYARVIVAGGAGGGNDSGTSYYGGHGGGTQGFQGTTLALTTSAGGRYGGGGSQTQGGAAATENSWGGTIVAGSFGQGGESTSPGYSNGGGGGWYGGGASSPDGGAGGGSSYVYTEDTAANYPSGCLLDSSMYLTNASTIAGNATITEPNGATNTGHIGNGYVRITVVKGKADLVGKKLTDPTPDYHITDDTTINIPVYPKDYTIVRNNLIYDRTLTDVNNAKSNPSNYEYNKGNYNYTDLNRVEAWCSYMHDLLISHGYGCEDMVDTKTNWKIGELPKKEDLNRIKNNVLKVRQAYFTYSTTPNATSLSIDKNKVNYSEANAMEKIIRDVYERLYNNCQIYRKLGVFRLGQNFIWQQRFRRAKSWDSIIEQTFSEFDALDIMELITGERELNIPLEISKETTVIDTIDYLNDYYNKIDKITGDVYANSGVGGKYYWFNGDYKTLLQKSLANHGIGATAPTYDGNSPTLNGYDYALYGYYDEDGETLLDTVTQRKVYSFEEFVNFVSDPNVPKDLDSLDGTIKVASYTNSLTTQNTTYVPTKANYHFAGWQKIVDEETQIENDYNFTPIFQEALYMLPNATTFDGSSTYVDTNLNLFEYLDGTESTNGFTLCLTFSTNQAASSSYPTIFHEMKETTPYPGLTFDIGTTGGRLALVTPSNPKPFTNAMNTGTKNGLVLTCDGANVRTVAYVDGTQDKDATYTLGQQTNCTSSVITNNLILGAYQTTDGTKGRYFNGTIYDFEVYDGVKDTTWITNWFDGKYSE